MKVHRMLGYITHVQDISVSCLMILPGEQLLVDTDNVAVATLVDVHDGLSEAGNVLPAEIVRSAGHWIVTAIKYIKNLPH